MQNTGNCFSCFGYVRRTKNAKLMDDNMFKYCRILLGLLSDGLKDKQNIQNISP